MYFGAAWSLPLASFFHSLTVLPLPLPPSPRQAHKLVLLHTGVETGFFPILFFFFPLHGWETNLLFILSLFPCHGHGKGKGVSCGVREEKGTGVGGGGGGGWEKEFGNKHPFMYLVFFIYILLRARETQQSKNACKRKKKINAPFWIYIFQRDTFLHI